MLWWCSWKRRLCHQVSNCQDAQWITYCTASQPWLLSFLIILLAAHFYAPYNREVHRAVVSAAFSWGHDIHERELLPAIQEVMRNVNLGFSSVEGRTAKNTDKRRLTDRLWLVSILRLKDVKLFALRGSQSTNACFCLIETEGICGVTWKMN